MKFIEFKGEISTPGNANNSNIDPNIEITEVTNCKTKEKVKVKILRDPSNYLNPILNNLTDKDLYNEEIDCNGVPLLNRIEKYPNLPEDVFIPIEFIKDGFDFKLFSSFLVNKQGKYINIDTKNYLSLSLDKKYNYYNLNIKINKKTIIVRSHIPETHTFLFIPSDKINVYKFINHIDHSGINNKINNLEFVTPATNANKESGRCSIMSEEKLTKYIAYDDIGNELFSINRRNTNGFSLNSIHGSIKNNIKYRGYYWKRSKFVDKNSILNNIGFSGNLKDYIWYKHWKYAGLFICKEGFAIYKGKLTFTIRNNYVYFNNIRANRVIAEFLLGRDLRKNEIVDHINTNTLDNSFENLRVTDAKGNRNNIITRSKFSEKLILTDLFGNFIMCNFPKELYNFLGRTVSNNLTANLINYNIINNKYICINIGDIENLIRKMEKVLFIYEDNKLKYSIPLKEKILGLSKIFPTIHKQILREVVNNNLSLIIKNNTYTFEFGKEAVKKVISLGNGNAVNYCPKDEKIDLNIIDYNKYNHLIVSLDDIIKLNKIYIEEFDMFGNFIRKFDYSSSSSNYSIYNILNGRSFSHNDTYFYCKEGDESIIKTKLNYVYYKYDCNGILLSSSYFLWKLIDEGINFDEITSSRKIQKIRKEFYRYLNTGMLAPDGFYYQQGIDFIEPDPNNVDLIPKRPILKWTPKNKRNNKNDIS